MIKVQEKVVDTFYRNYNKIGLRLVKLLVKELKAQGHKGSGKLINSIISEVQGLLDEVELIIESNYYGRFLNDGVPPSRIPFSPAQKRSKGQTKRTSKYIEALMDWIKKMGFTSGIEADIKSTAFAIATKHTKYGNPIPYRFLKKKSISKNQRRRGWIDITLKEFEVELEEKVADVQTEFVESALDNLLKQIARQNKCITYN